LKADLNSVSSLHKDGFLFTASRTFKSAETIPVLDEDGTAVGGTVTAAKLYDHVPAVIIVTT
jgi:hypothetical protein